LVAGVVPVPNTNVFRNIAATMDQAGKFADTCPTGFGAWKSDPEVRNALIS
jgi:hypothetical protein